MDARLNIQKDGRNNGRLDWRKCNFLQNPYEKKSLKLRPTNFQAML